MNPVTLKALLFDVDGTLADTEEHGHRPAYNRAFRKLGHEFRWGPKLYRRLLRQQGGRERLEYYARRYQPQLCQDEEALHRWVDSVHHLKSHYFRYYLRKGKVPLRPGVARLIGEARAAGVRVALVSNASRASIRPLLEFGLGSDLSAHIDLVVSGDDVLRKKPAPDSYLVALKSLGVRPEECVALEDSGAGLCAATAAGIATVITVNPNTAGENFDDARLVLDHLGEPDQPACALRGQLLSPHLQLADLIALEQPAS